MREARKILQARLGALARGNQRLIGSNWSGLCLREIARSELKLFSDQITVDGPDIGVGPKNAQNLALAFHELATNAAKYGALSNGNGTVRLSWTVTENSEDRMLKINGGRAADHLSHRRHERASALSC